MARLWFFLPFDPPDLLPGVHIQLAFYSVAILKINWKGGSAGRWMRSGEEEV
jgi:hypothetical protein